MAFSRKGGKGGEEEGCEGFTRYRSLPHSSRVALQIREDFLISKSIQNIQTVMGFDEIFIINITKTGF